MQKLSGRRSVQLSGRDREGWTPRLRRGRGNEVTGLRPSSCTRLPGAAGARAPPQAVPGRRPSTSTFHDLARYGSRRAQSISPHPSRPAARAPSAPARSRRPRRLPLHVDLAFRTAASAGRAEWIRGRRDDRSTHFRRWLPIFGRRRLRDQQSQRRNNARRRAPLCNALSRSGPISARAASSRTDGSVVQPARIRRQARP